MTEVFGGGLLKEIANRIAGELRSTPSLVETNVAI
jgi:hypothetical protein